MSTHLLAALLDSIITIGVGTYLLVARRSLVAKVHDPVKKERVDKILRICAPGMIVCALFLAVSKVASYEDELSRLARQANASLPKPVDANTRLERITVEKPRRLVYHLTSLAGTAKDVDRIGWGLEKVKIEARVRNAPEMKKLLSAGITLVYRYKDRNNVFIDELIVSPIPADKGKNA